MKFNGFLAAAFAALFWLVSPAGYAAEPAMKIGDQVSKPVAEKIRGAVENWTKGRYQVAEIRRTPLSTLYEVRIQNDLFYVDEAARFILVEGDMIDMSSGKNLTRDRMDEVLAIDFSKLPLDVALKQVRGNGKRKIAIFEDPNCGYCRKLRQDFVSLDNVTIYTFVYPILAADSDVKARKALCAKEPVKAWTDLMLTGRVPQNDGSCKNSLERIRALGQSLGVSATPTLFFSDGRRLQGYAPPPQFAQLLDAHSR
ncbi:MAG: DsbC family protein [Burkholderiaceae bacterium]|nr:DsbC family protein [Burkholderiaceae bacterium]